MESAGSGTRTRAKAAAAPHQDPARRGHDPIDPHTLTDGEPALDARELGFFLGLMTGEGHFGGDGRQPQLTLRMHTRHEALFRWLERQFPGGRLYGPYDHGGRSYFQWMARGRYLRERVAPLVAANVDLLDDPTRARFLDMARRYGIALPVAVAAADDAAAHDTQPRAHQGGDATHTAADGGQPADDPTVRRGRRGPLCSRREGPT